MPTRGVNNHRHSIRLKNYDYTQSGAYFVTIVAHQRQPILGEIADANMALTSLGQIVLETWDGIPRHFPFVGLDAFVIMPNHLHGIIMIDRPNAFLSDETKPNWTYAFNSFLPQRTQGTQRKREISQ